MAAKYPQEIPELEPESLDTVEISVRKTFNSLIQQLIEKRDQLTRLICEIREEYLYNEAKRIGNLKSLEDRIIKKQEENAECYSKTNDRMIQDLSAQKEECKHPNPIPTPPRFNTSHLDELRDQIERFGELDYSIPIYTSKLSPIRSIGKKGVDELYLPCGVALDGTEGNIFIADTLNGRIQLVSLEGQFIGEFGKGEFGWPYSIALYNDWLFVTDSNRNKVLKYKTQNYILLEYKSELELNFPLGITVDNNEVFVADSNNNRIVVLNLDLEFITEIGNKKLVNPRDVKVKNNKVFVADNSKHHNVHIFTKLGDLLNSIINLRDGTGSIFLCLDKFNNILISDWSGKVIQIYTLEGLLIHSIECDYTPTGIAVTQDNIIICADIINGQLNLY